MKSKAEIEQELYKCEQQLESISKTKYTGVKYDYERGETYGEETSYKQYSDPKMAAYLIERINNLKNDLSHYERDSRIHEAYMTERKEMAKQYQETLTINKALELYNQAVDEYNKKNIFQKVGMMFAGKKPKKNLNGKEVMQQYGGEAEYMLMQPGVNEKIVQLQQDKEQIKEYYKNSPDLTELQKEIFINSALKQIDEEIEKLTGLLEEKRNGMKK